MCVKSVHHVWVEHFTVSPDSVYIALRLQLLVWCLGHHGEEQQFSRDSCWPHGELATLLLGLVLVLQPSFEIQWFVRASALKREYGCGLSAFFFFFCISVIIW